MTTVIPTWDLPTTAVAGTSERFPVRRIWCVGRNYAAHAHEMGFDPKSTPPCFFAKPADAVVADGAVLPYPSATHNLHHEVELVVALGKGGANVAEADALGLIYGYAVGIDLTRRDLQADARKAGEPWDMAKGFDRSAPLGPIHPAATLGHPTQASIRLWVNGQIRQDANIADLIWNVPETIAALSRLVELKAGDLIFTGTPEGVGPVVSGDRMEAEIEGLGRLTVSIA